MKKDRECSKRSFESHRNTIIGSSDANSDVLSYKLFGFFVCVKAYTWLYAITKSTMHRIQNDARSSRKV